MHDDHFHVHVHDHDHAHEDGHCHTHTHDGQATPQSDAESIALLKYMIDHNQHHGEDLHEIYHSLEAAGKREAAELVHEAIHQYDHGNEKLAEALKLIGG